MFLTLQQLETYLLRELSILKHLRSAEQKYFVSFIGAYDDVETSESSSLCSNPGRDGQDSFSLYIITEYCQGGDLLSLLDASKAAHKSNIALGWKFRTKIALEASLAVHYLHENNFLHRDIKSEVSPNVLFCVVLVYDIAKSCRMRDVQNN